MILSSIFLYYFYSLSSLIWVYALFRVNFCIGCDVRVYFYTRVSNYSSRICWKKKYHVFIALPCHFCLKSINYVFMGPFPDFCFVQFIYTPIIMPISCGLRYCSFSVSLKIKWCNFSNFTLFKNCFGPLHFHKNVKISFLFSTKKG